MTHLSLPRVHFLGKFRVNPATANNLGLIDLENVKLNIEYPDNLSSMEQLQAWRQTLRQQLEAPELRGRNWDYYGDNSVRFEQTTVTGVELSTNEFFTTDESDSLIGASVDLLGSKFYDRHSHAVMVDLNPVGAYSSQIFSGLLLTFLTKALFLWSH